MEIKAKCKSYELSATSYKCPEAQNSSLVARSLSLERLLTFISPEAKQHLPLTSLSTRKLSL